MTATQKYILLFFSSLFFLSLTYFRGEWFTGSNAGLWLYRLLAMSGLLLLAISIGSLINKKAMWAALFLLIIGEGIFTFLFSRVKNGHQLPEKITAALSYIYQFHCRDYIIYDNERGQYDEQLFYTLKPGKFNYSNMEFSTEYKVNSAGFRDDEHSLISPKIIFLGDSYTMGWGVEQNENFATLLEKKLNRTALNTGIASYGTAREYLTFEKIDRDSCRLVILQFCPNDVTENNSFVQNSFQLNISSKEVFEKEVIANKLYKIYFPLKYIHSTIYFFIDKVKNKESEQKNEIISAEGGISEQELNDFFIILQKIKGKFSGNIVVFNLGLGITKPAVEKQFENWLTSHPVQGVHIFPAAQYLSKNDYLPLDTHLKKSGNIKLANGLEQFILENNLLQN